MCVSLRSSCRQGCCRLLTAGCGTPLTLLQVLLVVPRFLLFGHKFLHCSGVEHGTDPNRAGETSPSVCVSARVWTGTMELREAAAAVAAAPSRRSCKCAGRAGSAAVRRGLLDVFPLLLHPVTPTFHSQHRLV